MKLFKILTCVTFGIVGIWLSADPGASWTKFCLGMWVTISALVVLAYWFGKDIHS